MLQNGTIMAPKKHYYAGKMHYYAGIMLDAPHIVLCSKLCRHNVSTPTHCCRKSGSSRDTTPFPGI